MYSFTLTTKSDEYYEVGDVIFTDTGDVIGRILRRSITEISEDEYYCSYRVEASEDIYKDIKNGIVRVSGFDSYSVHA